MSNASASTPCGCVEKHNERLAQSGYVAELHDIVRFTDEHPEGEVVGLAPQIALTKFGNRAKSKPAMWARYCPICGKSLLKEPTCTQG